MTLSFTNLTIVTFECSIPVITKKKKKKKKPNPRDLSHTQLYLSLTELRGA